MGFFKRASQAQSAPAARSNAGLEFRRRAVGPCDVYDGKEKRVLVTVATDGSISGNRDDIEFVTKLIGKGRSLQEYVRELAIPMDEEQKDEDQKKKPAGFWGIFRKNLGSPGSGAS